MSVSGNSTDFQERFAASVANWKRKLLDLTRRNRLLNFKPTRVSTVAVVDEQPAEIFRHMYVDERIMKFRADPAKRGRELAGPEPTIDTADFDSESESALEYVPYDASAADERHRDSWLQTSLSSEELDHALRRIEQLARTSIEEQGVTTLFLTLGMLRYRESRDSETWFRAPLVLLPVKLERSSARTGFSLKPTDEDAVVNPALAEYLRASYGISLPSLPDPETISDAYDLQEFLRGTAQAIQGQTDWAIQTDIYLGLFSFQKLVMFKDLEANQGAIRTHRLIQQLLSRTGSAVHGLPPEIRELPLDREFTPEKTFQVVDADSSQMRAAAAVVRGHDIVIEGPPGTGKSQTITNLIAQALAAGKTVLFVAEKMAALEVVHRRLVSAGLGECCLELHSSKANKRLVMKELASALDASLQPIAGATSAARRLPEVRVSLNEYVQAVHTPLGQLGKSPYFVAGELGRVLDAPRLKLGSDVTEWTQADIDVACRVLDDFARHTAEIGAPDGHPWRGTGKTFYSEDELHDVVSLAQDVHARAASLAADAREVSAEFGLPLADSIADVTALADFADLLGESPGVAEDILQSEAWNSPPAAATALLEKGRKLRQLRDLLSPKLRDEAFGLNHAADIAFIERKSGGILSFLAFLDGRYRAIRQRWLAYRIGNYSAPLIDQAAVMRQVDEASALAAELDGSEASGRGLFGPGWDGAASNWDRLAAYIAYVVRYRGLALKRGLQSQAARVASQPHPDVSRLRTLANDARELQSRARSLTEAVAWPSGYLEGETLANLAQRAKDLADHPGKAAGWASFESSRQKAMKSNAAQVVEAVVAGELPYDRASAAFLRAFYMKWLSAAVQTREALRSFDTLTHEQLVAEFRQLDQKILSENRTALLGLLRDRAQQRLQAPDAAAGLRTLRREMAKQRRHSPLRRTLRECGAAVSAIKPCLMMSPLTVAQYLNGETPAFDLVIFDEASQLPTEDAVGAVIRGKQLVVVGDPKQLPPTDFFSVSTGTADAPLADDGTPLFTDTESVLEEFMGAAVPMSRLKWHYRSAHESLINFSNVNFYDADLHTFPSASTHTGDAGLQFHFVENGVYEGKGVNFVEARRIADEIVAFARLQIARKGSGGRPLSLGVGTLNLRQQLAILDELEVRRRDDPSIEQFFDRSVEEPFFVKNLENIQGDERDAIFLSVTYGRSPDGRVRYNFGPLNRENGWRRLNVLVTRARRQMKVFSSMRDHDINPVGAVSDGPRLLREFLAYAEQGQLAGSVATAAGDAESPFEREVATELVRRNIRVEQQVGVCGYRVDIGVLDDELPGMFVCGIECDGVAYHSMETVRDRDRLRQQVLESRGWTIHRVWSTDWFKDRQGQLDRLVALIAKSRERARNREVEPVYEPAVEVLVTSLETRPAASNPKQGATQPLSPPTLTPYRMYTGEGLRVSADILQTAPDILADAVRRVVEVEGPVHETDITARLAGLWDTRAGSRIQEAIRNAMRLAERQRRVVKRGPFFWRPDNTCEPRSREGAGIPGDRIAPEEYVEIVRSILTDGRSIPRADLVAQVRGAAGYSRTGAILDQSIGNVIDGLVLAGQLGEGSGGLVWRGATETR